MLDQWKWKEKVMNIEQGKEILKMIEEVDKEDTDKLDEIDARVHEYLGYYWHGDGDISEHKIMAGHWGYEKMVRTYRGCFVCDCRTDRDFAPDPKEYTRSLDAQEAIDLSEEWEYSICSDSTRGFNCNYGDRYSPWLDTEPLVRLHAKLQAYIWEAENA